MTRQETSIIMDILRAAFPAYYKRIDAQEAKAAITLWAEMFADDNVRDVAIAVKSLIATRVEGYPPTIGAVKEAMYKSKGAETLDESKAWDLVSKAISNGLYNYQREYDKLPPECQRAIGSAQQIRECAMMPTETVQSVVMSQFKRAYRIYAQRDKEAAMLPGSVRKAIEGIRMLHE